jgi:hypothetical protein
VFYVAPTQGQARDIMWQTLLELGHPVIAGSHINNLQIKLINGATISLKGGDRPETMRGVSLKYLVLDEYADIKPEVWEQILRPALADQKGSALFIGTPMGRNHFYELYKYGELSGDDTYRSWHFTSYDNPLLDPEEINVAKKSMSSYAFRQEFMASFEAKGSEMFKEEWVTVAEENTMVGDYYIAIDLAGFQDVSKKALQRIQDLTTPLWQWLKLVRRVGLLKTLYTVAGLLKRQLERFLKWLETTNRLVLELKEELLSRR